MCLHVCRGVSRWSGPEKATQFYLDWRPGAPLPPPDEVVAYEQPLHLRSTMNTRSIGHLLRDNLHALVDLPLRFGRDPVAFDWVRAAAWLAVPVIQQHTHLDAAYSR